MVMDLHEHVRIEPLWRITQRVSAVAILCAQPQMVLAVACPPGPGFRTRSAAYAHRLQSLQPWVWSASYVHRSQNLRLRATLATSARRAQSQGLQAPVELSALRLQSRLLTQTAALNCPVYRCSQAVSFAPSPDFQAELAAYAHRWQSPQRLLRSAAYVHRWQSHQLRGWWASFARQLQSRPSAPLA